MKKKTFYSDEITQILKVKDRLRIAKQIEKIIKSQTNTKQLKCLDIGCSSGVITNFLKKDFERIIGIDVDKNAIKIAKKSFKSKNLQFIEMSGASLTFPVNSFDFVICHQVYNFVDEPDLLVKNIYKVLKPGGLCYFSGRNKYALIEPQYKLPFLSWMSNSLGTKYIKLFKKGNIYFGINYMSYFSLKRLLSNFEIRDLTLDIIRHPKMYGFSNLRDLGILKIFIHKTILPVVPNYIFILKKL